MQPMGMVMRKLILLALLSLAAALAGPTVGQAQTAPTLPPGNTAPPVQPGAKNPNAAPTAATIDKAAQEKAQKANDALLERHSAAANRAIHGICAGCLGSAERVRVAAIHRPARRRARVTHSDEEVDDVSPEVGGDVFVATPSASSSPRDRWWVTR